LILEGCFIKIGGQFPETGTIIWQGTNGTARGSKCRARGHRRPHSATVRARPRPRFGPGVVPWPPFPWCL